MAFHRLQGVANGSLVEAIVDKQSGAAVLLQPHGDIVHQRFAGGGSLEDCAFWCRCSIGREKSCIKRGHASEKCEFPVLIEAHHALAPATRRLDELAYRQGVEQLVADDEERSFREILEPAIPFRRG